MAVAMWRFLTYYNIENTNFEHTFSSLCLEGTGFEANVLN